MRVVQTRQPVGPVRLDRSNPLTAGLIDVFVPGHRVNLVSGLSLAATGTASFVGVSQIGISLISSSASAHFHAVSTAPANVRVDEATLLVVTAPSAITETTRSMYGFGSTGGSNPLLFIGQSGTSSQLYFFARSDSGTAQNPTVTPPSGTWAPDQRAVVVGARSQSKNVHELYVNGIQAATTTATTIGATTLNATSVGGLRRSTDGIVYNGRTSLCLAWNRCLSAAEIKSISDNPWQIFEPIVVPVKTASGGAYTLTADNAAWQFAAQSATLRVARKLTADNAPWEFAAQNAGLTVARKIAAENAPWEFAVQDATLTYAPHTGAYTLTAESAEWQFAVPDATLTYSGAAIRRRGAAKPLRKGYIIRGKKYWLTDDELAIMVALELETIKRSDIKVPTKGRIKPIPTATFEMVKAVAKKLDELASIGLDDDEDEEEELLLML